MTRHFFPLMLFRMPSRSFCDCSLRAARLSGALSRLGICAICPGMSELERNLSKSGWITPASHRSSALRRSTSRDGPEASCGVAAQSAGHKRWVGTAVPLGPRRLLQPPCGITGVGRCGREELRRSGHARLTGGRGRSDRGRDGMCWAGQHGNTDGLGQT